jgi:L-fuconolactonase
LVVGVRRLLQHERPEVLRNVGLIAGSRLLASHGLAFDICITAEQLPAVTALVAKCPDTTFVLDHVGKPPIASGVLDSWRSNLRALAACSNVTCKLSGLATLASPGWQTEEILPQLAFAIDVFGPDRCMFGSDWPVLKLNSSYADWVTVVTEATSGLTVAERAGVFAGNAAGVYRLERTQRRDGDRRCS